MAAAALALYVAWFVLAFGVRTFIHLRRTGDSGFKGVGGRPWSLEWSAGVLFAVALFVGVAAPVAAIAGLDPIDPIGPLGAWTGWVGWVGAALATICVAATLAAQLSMGTSWRIGVDESERTDLVTGGAFDLVRNPIFSAMLLTAVGLTMMVANVVAIAGLAALVVALELQVRGVEEPYLAAVHGDQYLAYTRRVGRFVPRIGRV
ncbi:MAG: methyltransferase family protein [Acidimicrobiales bacterium]